MILRQLFDESTWTYTYLLADEQTRDAIIIDPVVERHERDAKLIEELGLTLRYTLETHVHADHVTGSGAMRDRFGAEMVLSSAAKVPCADIGAEHMSRLSFGAHQVEVRHTPGHTGGCASFVVVDGDQTWAFTGDALFIRGCGRTDFQQGDAPTLYRSVHAQLFSLPDAAMVYPGHDYNGATSSTIGEEKLHNPRLNLGNDEAAFVAIMDGLNLRHPRLIDVAVPANMACGGDVA